MKTALINGLVVDGTGKTGFIGSVLIDGEKIADVVSGKAAANAFADYAVRDVSGCVVSPGFIDSHSHSDAYLIVEPDAPSKLSQGITTEINGQCGGSVAPRYGEARLSSDWASVLGERLTWHSLSEYREAFAAAKPAINSIQFIGHNTLRSSVIGYAGVRATPEKLREMETLLARELDDGAWGLTTGLIYQPGKYSDEAEVTALAKTAADRGGMYATHMRSEGDRILEAIDEVIALVKATGIRAEISHLKTSGRRNWEKIDRVLEKMQAAIYSGLLVGSDRYPFCAAGTDLDVVFPDWAGEGAAKAEIERLKDRELTKRIAAEIDASGRNWDEVMIGGTWSEATRKYSGRRIGEILRETGGVSAGELICDILAKDACRTGAFFFGMSEENMRKIISMPWIVPGSDASLRAPWGPLGNDHPHPRAYGTMPEFYRMAGGNAAAIARMTSVPAKRFGIAGRGVLERGAYADIAVWKESEFANTATYAKSHSFCAGMRAVYVNGSLAYDGGRFTHAGSGRFLERNGR